MVIRGKKYSVATTGHEYTRIAQYLYTKVYVQAGHEWRNEGLLFLVVVYLVYITQASN
jgi:hypothetical protein